MDKYQMITIMTRKEMAAKMPCPYVMFEKIGTCIHKSAINKDCQKCCESWLKKKV